MVWGTPDRHSAPLWADRLSETGVGVLVLFSGLGLDIKSTTQQVCQDSGVVERERKGEECYASVFVSIMLGLSNAKLLVKKHHQGLKLQEIWVWGNL